MPPPLSRFHGDEMNNDEMTQREKAIGFLRESEIRWVKGFFTDLRGTLRAISLPAEALYDEGMWTHGKSIDGSSAGFSNVNSSDAYVRPDPDTMKMLPYTSEGLFLARVFMDVLGPDATTPHPSDPRGIARKAEKAVKEAGFSSIWFQPELEFYLFENIDEALLKNDLDDGTFPPGPGTGLTQYQLMDYLESKIPRPNVGGAYVSSPPEDNFDSLRDVFSSMVEEADIPIKFHHHECGSSQVEVEYKFTEGPVYSSDVSMYYKHLAKMTALERGFRPTFMPKPISGDAGNGMHFHIKLEKDGENAFSDIDDEHGLSQTGRYFLGGILEHARALCAVTNPSTNSYRRLVPHSEAPTMVAWGPSNRTALARIPSRGKVGLTDIEIRNPDPLCNPYLTTSLFIFAGLEGIKKKLDPGDPQVDNLYHLSPTQLKKRGITTLPRSLREAVYEFMEDPLIRDSLGEEAFNGYVENLEREIMDYQRRVPQWEIIANFDR